MTRLRIGILVYPGRSGNYDHQHSATIPRSQLSLCIVCISCVLVILSRSNIVQGQQQNITDPVVRLLDLGDDPVPIGAGRRDMAPQWPYAASDSRREVLRILTSRERYVPSIKRAIEDSNTSPSSRCALYRCLGIIADPDANDWVLTRASGPERNLVFDEWLVGYGYGCPLLYAADQMRQIEQLNRMWRLTTITEDVSRARLCGALRSFSNPGSMVSLRNFLRNGEITVTQACRILVTLSAMDVDLDSELVKLVTRRVKDAADRRSLLAFAHLIPHEQLVPLVIALSVDSPTESNFAMRAISLTLDDSLDSEAWGSWWDAHKNETRRVWRKRLIERFDVKSANVNEELMQLIATRAELSAPDLIDLYQLAISRGGAIPEIGEWCAEAVSGPRRERLQRMASEYSKNNPPQHIIHSLERAGLFAQLSWAQYADQCALSECLQRK